MSESELPAVATAGSVCFRPPEAGRRTVPHAAGEEIRRYGGGRFEGSVSRTCPFKRSRRDTAFPVKGRQDGCLLQSTLEAERFPVRGHRCPCGNGVKGKVECRAPCTGVQMLARLSPFFTIFGARRCLPAVRSYPRRKANGFLCALTSNRAVQVGAACFPARRADAHNLFGLNIESGAELSFRRACKYSAAVMACHRRKQASLRAGAQMPTGFACEL